MIELRKDYFLDRWVIISEARGQRPHEFASAAQEPSKVDFFAPGNEELTPPEIGRWPKSGTWKMRWFPNKFAAVEGDVYGKAQGDILHRNMPAFGYHEIIVENPSASAQLWDLGQEELNQVIKIYQQRTKQLSKKRDIRYVQIFKNSGKEAGASLIHSHTQVVALPSIPSLVEEKRKAMQKLKKTYQDVLNIELKSERRSFETKHWGAICPYASRFNYELLVIPKKKYSSIVEMPAFVLSDLAKMLYLILQKAKKSNWPYNFYFIYDPQKKMSFHIEFTPRLANWAGFEFSTGIVINSVSPEDAAQFYRS